MMQVFRLSIPPMLNCQVYSNGLSEIILGKAIKELKLPRDEIVIMTKVRRFNKIVALLMLYPADWHRCARIRHKLPWFTN